MIDTRRYLQWHDTIASLLEATSQGEAIGQSCEEAGQVEGRSDAVQHIKLAVEGLHFSRGTLLLEPLLSVSLGCWAGTNISFGF